MVTDVSDNPIRLIILAPTYNNARMLPAVLEGLAKTGLPVVVVDDGCTDSTPDILRTWAGGDERFLITHSSNRGKAAALRTGFAFAFEKGFTHALTIDTDGQHDIADVAPLAEVAKQNPRALVVGARPAATEGYPVPSKLGRAISNFSVWLESGARVSDSQCGLRVYPLHAVISVGASSERYGFETEIITRLAWVGVPIVEAPIRCVYNVAGGRVSHFRPFLDSVHAVLIHMRLVTRSVTPLPVRQLPSDAEPPPVETGTMAARFLRWLNPVTVFRQIRKDVTEQKRLASSMAVGIFMATLPIYGVKTVACLLLARIFRLQPLVVIAVSSLSTPPTGVLLATMAIASGHFLLHRSWPALHRFDPFQNGFLNTFKAVAAEWIVGGFVLGICLAVILYGVVRLVTWATSQRTLSNSIHTPIAR